MYKARICCCHCCLSGRTAGEGGMGTHSKAQHVHCLYGVCCPVITYLALFILVITILWSFTPFCYLSLLNFYWARKSYAYSLFFDLAGSRNLVSCLRRHYPIIICSTSFFAFSNIWLPSACNPLARCRKLDIWSAIPCCFARGGRGIGMLLNSWALILACTAGLCIVFTQYL